MCYVRHINPAKIHPERITQNNKKLANDLHYNKTEFSVREKDISKIEKKKTFALMRFVMKIGEFFQSMFQIKSLKTHWICCL